MSGEDDVIELVRRVDTGSHFEYLFSSIGVINI